MRGYVRIHISGFSVERLINQAALAGIVFWDVQRVGGMVHAKVSRRDYWLLGRIAEKTGTDLKVAAKVGLPAIAKRYKKRVVLLLGCLIFAAGLVILTSFIWKIDIQGNDRICTDEMLEFLAGNDFATGTFRHGIAYRDVERLLMSQFGDIAWVSLSITGTRAQIRLIEAIPPPEIIDMYTPTDIVAAKDGIIVQMATSRGTPLFVPGDVVRQGEVLVSGQLAIGVEGEEITFEYTRAESVIWARLHYRISFDIPLVFYEKTFTGRTQRVYSIMITGREFTLPHRRHSFIYYESIAEHGQLSLGQNYPLPLSYTITQHHEITRHLRSRTAEEAIAIGEEMIMGRIHEELPDGAQIITREISFTEGERVVTAEVFLVTIERIDVARKMN